MLIAMAGLPGTGKSAIAARLATELGGVVLNKDSVRSQLFPEPVLDYSGEQDDTAMAAIYAAAKLIRRDHPRAPVILDGRTFRNAYQVEDLIDALGQPRVIECVADDEVVRDRLASDLAEGNHPARNRTFTHYLELKAGREELTCPRLVLDTGTCTIEECVRRAMHYICETES